MKRILSSDLLIADLIAHPPRAKVNELIELAKTKWGMDLAMGEKYPLNREQYLELKAFMQDMKTEEAPGGSSANTLTTLSKLLDGKVQAKFIGIIGDEYNDMINRSLAEADIELLTPACSDKNPPRTAISYVIVPMDEHPSENGKPKSNEEEEKGERIILTYKGNVDELIKPELITEDMVDNADALLVQGSLWQKLDKGVANKLLGHRWDKHEETKHKELWLTLPTQAKFGEEQAGLFQWLITSANVVMSNESELARIYHTDPRSAILKLQEVFKYESSLEKEGRANGRDQVAFITRGKEGSVVVTKNQITYLHGVHVPKEQAINKLGAGDTSYAGFLAGYVSKLSNGEHIPYEDCARIGMTLAAEKIKQDGPRLNNPSTVLRNADPHLAEMLGIMPKQITLENFNPPGIPDQSINVHTVANPKPKTVFIGSPSSN